MAAGVTAGFFNEAGHMESSSAHYTLPKPLVSALLHHDEAVGTEDANEGQDEPRLITDLSRLGTSLQRSLPATISGRLDFSAESGVDMTDQLFQAARVQTSDTKRASALKSRQRLQAKFWRLGLVDEEDRQEIQRRERSGSLSSVSDVSIDLDHVTFLNDEDMADPQNAPTVAERLGRNEVEKCAGRHCWLRKIMPEVEEADEDVSEEDQTDSSDDHLKNDLGPARFLQDEVSLPSLVSPENRLLVQSRRLLYRTLKHGQTRILRIHPGEPHEPLRADLVNMRIGQRGDPRYEPIMLEDGYFGWYQALSYCWGTSPASEYIVLNGLDHLITPNLHSALRRLRPPPKYDPSYIWIDALCIDQANNHEKSVQVANMLSIYQCAGRVIIWLGELDDVPEVNLSAVGFVKALDQPYYRQLLFERSHDDKCLRVLSSAFEGLKAILARPWFRRTWVRQELAAAEKISVRLGAHELSWRSVKRAANRIHRVAELLKTSSEESKVVVPARKNLEYLKKSWRYGEPLMRSACEPGSAYYFHAGGLLDLLISGTIFDATNPRDHIYGILGMAQEPIASLDDTDNDLSEHMEGDENPYPHFRVDYSKSTSAVFQRLVKYVINRDQNLDILSLLPTFRGPNSAIDLPSWTPDWRISPSESSWVVCNETLVTQVFASGCTRAEPQDLAREGRLKVRGMLLDFVGESKSFGCFAYELVHENEDLKVQAVKKDGEEMVRQCFETENGNLLLAPGAARKGDLVLLLMGARTLFVLRRKEVEGDVNCFELIGPAWCRGVMMGQIFSMFPGEALDERLEEFDLV